MAIWAVITGYTIHSSEGLVNCIYLWFTLSPVGSFTLGMGLKLHIDLTVSLSDNASIPPKVYIGLEVEKWF
jgi:hypothetical protein